MTFATENTTPVTQAEAPAVVGVAVPPTKEERIAKLEDQIAKLQQRIQDIKDGKPAKAAAPAAPLPKAGDVVEFKYGRKTADTEPRNVTGTVLAVKEGGTVDGKRQPTLIKVQFGEGFDVQVAVIYPNQIVAAA